MNSRDWACQTAPATAATPLNVLNTANLHNAPSMRTGGVTAAPGGKPRDDISAATSPSGPPSTSTKRKRIADQEKAAYPHNLASIYPPLKERRDLSTAAKRTKRHHLPPLDPLIHAEMLRTMGIRVRDFAYEPTLFRVSSLYFHPRQVQPALKRGLTRTDTEPDIGSDSHCEQLGSYPLPAGHQPLARLQGFLNL